MATLVPPITVEDYKVLPETGPNYQLIDGTLYMSPSPTRFHQHLSRNLEFIIFQWIKAGGGGEVYNAPLDVYLDDVNVFQPDLIYVSAGNLDLLTDAGIEGGPDLVVEILSPSTEKLDLGPKKKIFASHGVKEFWAIDPKTRSVEIYDLAANVDAPAMTLAETDQLESSILPGLKINLKEVFDF